MASGTAVLVREATSIVELIEEVTPESIFMTNNEVGADPAHPQVRSTVDLRGFTRRRPGRCRNTGSGVQPAVASTTTATTGSKTASPPSYTGASAINAARFFATLNRLRLSHQQQPRQRRRNR